MKFKKPHFWYSKNQRNGVLFLLLVIVVLQLTYSFVDFSTNEKVFNDEEIGVLESKIDSLKKIEIESRKPIIYPFNPNYITDDKGLQLGMSIEEIDRLFDFRKKNAFINSVKEFQNITKVSDILLNKISPYFKFPDWVVKQNQPKITALSHKKIQIKTSTININLATVSDLESINGVPKYLAERIIKYREKLQGFTFEDQLFEVWKLDKETAVSILTVFKIVDKPIIKKINVNTATFKEVLSNPYIDYDLCKKIFDFKDKVAELQSIEELKNIDGFPLDKYGRITLYLEAK